MKPTKCCGQEPEVKPEYRDYQRGRRSPVVRKSWWEVTCTKCRRHVQGYSEADAVTKWNDDIERERGRKASKDKLIWDLEHSDDDVKLALARLLRFLGLNAAKDE